MRGLALHLKFLSEEEILAIRRQAGLELAGPESAYTRLQKTEWFYMSRLEAIFLALCPELKSRGKIQFYKAAGIAEKIEEALKKWNRMNLRG